MRIIFCGETSYNMRAMSIKVAASPGLSSRAATVSSYHQHAGREKRGKFKESAEVQATCHSDEFEDVSKLSCTVLSAAY